ncbi:hypothetical protein NMD14_10210 [Aeromonas veronii]
MSDPKIIEKGNAKAAEDNELALTRELLDMVDRRVSGRWDRARLRHHLAQRLPEIDHDLLIKLMVEVLTIAPEIAFENGKNEALSMMRKVFK